MSDSPLNRVSAHGPLAVLLLVLTVITGLVDAFSFLMLGHVFVANMTGNVVFFAFALGGAPGFVWWASLLALAAFLIGAFVGGWVATWSRAHRARQLFWGSVLQAAFVVAALITSIVAAVPGVDGYQGIPLVALIALLGVAMGLQNATARSLKVPDMTTTVLTLTITGIGADSAIAGGGGSKLGRRVLSIAAMFLGALLGVLALRWGSPALLLGAVLVLLVAVIAVSAFHLRSDESWVEGEHRRGR